jgi:hypothetical protein
MGGELDTFAAARAGSAAEMIDNEMWTENAAARAGSGARVGNEAAADGFAEAHSAWAVNWDEAQVHCAGSARGKGLSPVPAPG